MWGMPITVEFQADQLSLYTTTTSSVSSTISISATTNSASQSTGLIPTNTSSPLPTHPSSELSAGAKAGIAVGAVGSALILFAIAILGWRQKGGISGNDEGIHEADKGSQYLDTKAELGMGEYRKDAELGAEYRISEMPT